MNAREPKEAEMSVLVTLELPDTTTAQYDRMKELARLAADDVPSGLVTHACAVTDDGILIAEVWESQSALDDFVGGRLVPALTEAGIPQPVARI
jgi:hypothetical protein